MDNFYSQEKGYIPMHKKSQVDLYIKALSAQINIMKNSHDISEKNEEQFNKLLIKKAILIKINNRKPLLSALNQIKRKLFKEEKLICDYF